MEAIRGRALESFHTRLKERLAELLDGSGLDPQRLAQEAALLADRSDIGEEIARLRDPCRAAGRDPHQGERRRQERSISCCRK